MGANTRKINVVFVGRQLRGLNKDHFVEHLKGSHFLSARVSHDAASRVNIPSGAAIPDEYVFDFPAVDEGAWCNVLVFRSPLEGNWFSRSNFGEIWYDSREVLIVAVTSHELEDFAHDAEMSLEKALAANALRAIVSADYVKSGGKFWELWSKYSEDGAFAFCKDKSEIVDRLIHGRLGERTKMALGARGYTDESVVKLEHDFQVLSQSFADRVKSVARNNRDIIISTVFFLFGILVTLLFEATMA